MDRCRAEIAAIEAQLRAGHPDVEGLCRALADWYAEMRLIKAETPNEKARRGRSRAGESPVRADVTSRDCKRARRPRSLWNRP